MRKASNNYGLIVLNDVFVGISLGYDYCAEHEWGIKKLKTLCDIPEGTKMNMGVESRTIRKTPLLLFQKQTVKNIEYALLCTKNSYYDDSDINKHIPHCFTNYVSNLQSNKKWTDNHPDRESKDNISTAWDESSFGIAVMGEKEVGWLSELNEAFQDKNVTIAVVNLMAKNPFAGSSLSLLITDRIPKESLDLMYSADKEYFDRIDYEEKIGMKKIIEKYGNKNGYNGDKYFMACSPKWIDYNNKERLEEQKKKLNTKYDIVYWINYSDNDNNCGYYSVEEIKKWLTTPKLHLVEIRKG
jgi:hypothetical protein